MRRKKELTEAQKQASAERKEKMRDICRQIKAMDDAERIRLASSVQAVSIEGQTYSAHNQCMIAFQNRSATVLGGFRQWMKHGRKVMKGEHGLGIWVPIFCEKDAQGEGQGVEGYIFGTVFDVSQTEDVA